MMVPGLWEVEINSGSGKNSNSKIFSFFICNEKSFTLRLSQISKRWSTTLTAAVTSFKSIPTHIQ